MFFDILSVHMNQKQPVLHTNHKQTKIKPNNNKNEKKKKKVSFCGKHFSILFSHHQLRSTVHNLLYAVTQAIL